MRFARRAALLLFVAVSATWFALARAEEPSVGLVAPRTLILLRHAEKDPNGHPKNPSLSEAGRERAARFARLFARVKPAHLWTSELVRTQETIEPFAKERGASFEVLSAAKPELAIAAIQSLAPGEVGVLVGHSNTLPAIARGLGVALERLVDGPGGPQLPDDEFGRVFVITLPPAGAPVAPSVVELAY